MLRNALRNKNTTRLLKRVVNCAGTLDYIA